MKRKIKILVKRVQFQQITIDEDSFDVPEDINGFVEFCQEVKASPMDFALDINWETCNDETGIQSFEIVEG